ncbi:LuxR family transcriptional regulator [Aneurinibacillus migulanus]|uniref:response regulator transcription factor n=1 Tax=Aneurinibacillus migulanus TaxID=47500 RepID=UPI0005BE6306|nr:response regulator transcription factor [Aneurinibacillus migulanus]KIV57386.1 LuxR family transcriptional regulator [Aneurinibacillus migulanus]KPD07953.1 LuxR family transcriptional regulator [Aneurinibacillus migulanus]MCP1358052.1 response regulator transcription factor [Aneurinibacillus migulanus]CEH28739.1 DNA-binding response regulator, luxR family prote in [Aneurinibacillus migulanus]
MATKIKVVLLDDHPLVIDALKHRLEQEEDICVTGTFADPRLLLEQIRRNKPDVLVMDISMPHMDGFQLAVLLKKEYGSALKIIMLSGYTYEEFYLKAYEIGVNAYLSKQASYVQIINAIRQSLAGHMLVPERLFMAYGQDKLTPTEREVLVRISQEMSNKEIARELGISQRTVEYHLTSILQKMGVKSRVGAVAKGYELGIIGAAGSNHPQQK